MGAEAYNGCMTTNDKFRHHIKLERFLDALANDKDARALMEKALAATPSDTRSCRMPVSFAYADEGEETVHVGFLCTHRHDPDKLYIDEEGDLLMNLKRKVMRSAPQVADNT